jgi:hypothetical protein
MNFKDIEIGYLIQLRVGECKVKMSRICDFFELSEWEIEKMYQSKSLDSEILLKWSKLLGYDFFRIYTQHLILYAPPAGNLTPSSKNSQKKLSRLPKFRRNIYTKEVIDFLLELVEKGEKTKQQVIDEYNIPKTTLYRWIEKHTIVDIL